MDNILDLPERTWVNKTVQKNAFYQRADSGRKGALQEFLEQEVQEIVWLYKLHPSTFSVKPGEVVEEIDVFVFRMKYDYYALPPIQEIDGLLPRQTLLFVEYGVSRDLVLNVKQKNEVKGEQVWKIVQTEMQRHVDMGRFALHFEGLSMDSYFAKMLGQVSGFHTLTIADYKVSAEIRSQIEKLRKQVLALQKQISKEKQFNRQVELNAEARQLKKEISALEDRMKKIHL